jgi:hypothetical protein
MAYSFGAIETALWNRQDAAPRCWGFPSTTNLTIAFWYRLDTTKTVDDRSIYNLGDNWVANQPWWYFRQPNWGGAGNLGWVVWNGNGAWTRFTDYDEVWWTEDVGNWHHVAYVKTGDVHRLYRDGILLWISTVALPANTDAWAQGIERIGCWTADQGGVSVAYFRQWEAALSRAEVLAEMQSATAVRTTNLWRSFDMAGLTAYNVDRSTEEDHSGSGHHMERWTAFGLPATVTDPTLPILLPDIAATTGRLGTNLSMPGNVELGWVEPEATMQTALLSHFWADTYVRM